jgi:hypothetical protein
MPRRPKAPPPTAGEIEAAFARNVAWLEKFGPVLPRHMLLVGHLMPIGITAALAELQRWIDAGRLVETRTGDLQTGPEVRGLEGADEDGSAPLIHLDIRGEQAG